MQDTARPVDPELVEQIKRTIHQTMDPFGLRSLELGITGQVAIVVRELVRKTGETRFPHIRHMFHEKQKVKEPARRARG
jgi:hypothetical protein